MTSRIEVSIKPNVNVLEDESGKIAMYEVVVKKDDQYEWTIMRRYNQFHDLDSKLKSSFKGLPPFPPKMVDVSNVPFSEKLFTPEQRRGHFDPTFIEERRVALESYLVRILKIPCFSRHTALLTFLEPDSSRMPGGPEVALSRPSGMQEQHLQLASACLAEGLFDDPRWSHLFPLPAVRKDALDFFCPRLVWVSYMYGYAYGIANPQTPGAIGGVALWIPPAHDVTLMDLLTSGIAVKAPWRYGYNITKEMQRIFKIYDQHRAHIMGGQRHWYLWYIATDPRCRRQGFARDLLEDVLTLSDKNDQPCYAECSNPTTLDFFVKFGFEAVETHEGPYCVMMKRKRSSERGGN